MKKHNLYTLLAFSLAAVFFSRTLAPAMTVQDRLTEFAPAVHTRLRPDFQRIGLAYPPSKITLIGLKHERILELWVAAETGPCRLLKRYPILAASGQLGPKLREGDEQVPEGLYRIELLNPNSLYHLSLRVNYPNAHDREHAAAERRTKLGGDIMIHGKNCSIGCLAMGDPAAEELFVLAAETGIKNISIILSPIDFRVRELPAQLPPLPAWTPALYQEIKDALLPFQKP